MDSSTFKAYTSPRGDVLALIGSLRLDPPSLVLDVGCSNGELASGLRERFPAACIHGIERDPGLAAAAAASGSLHAVHAVDLDGLVHSPAPGASFDLIICADVLEHTKEPARVLSCLLDGASPGVKVILSLPNVQHWTVFWELLRGRWPARERGIFDRTHLRFFTLASIHALARSCGLRVTALRRNYRIADAPAARVNRFSHYARFLPARAFFTYQYLAVLERDPAVPLVAPE